jgi:hypothetical protein
MDDRQGDVASSKLDDPVVRRDASSKVTKKIKTREKTNIGKQKSSPPAAAAAAAAASQSPSPAAAVPGTSSSDVPPPPPNPFATASAAAVPVSVPSDVTQPSAAVDESHERFYSPPPSLRPSPMHVSSQLNDGVLAGIQQSESPRVSGSKRTRTVRFGPTTHISIKTPSTDVSEEHISDARGASTLLNSRPASRRTSLPQSTVMIPHGSHRVPPGSATVATSHEAPSAPKVIKSFITKLGIT